MRTSYRILFLLAVVLVIAGCTGREKGGVRAEIKTTEGDIIIALSDLTPFHRDNFIKLAESGFYDGVSFHRVIKEFMIQTGDGTTKADTTMLPEDYTIPAEINDSLYHKRGAVAAARTGDDVNPERNSSGTQFYIVQEKPTMTRILMRLSAVLISTAGNFYITRPWASFARKRLKIMPHRMMMRSSKMQS